MLYNIINGQKSEVNHSNYTYPHNFFIYKNDSLKEYILRIFIECDTTLLQLNQSVVDTIVVTIEKIPDLTTITKVWYNGKVVWSPSVIREFTIIKSNL